MRIGITERGDAGLDLSWRDRLREVDGCVLVTKRLSRRFCEALLEADDGRIVLHATCTGWGGTAMEPNVYAPGQTLASLGRLVAAGFPKERCVLRIDPVVPTEEGLRRLADTVGACEADPLLRGVRKRVSVLDQYRHARERMAAAGIDVGYPGGGFRPSREQWNAVAATLAGLHERHGAVFETCAEPELAALPCVEACGCIGPRDLALMGLEAPDGCGSNPQGRSGCLCLSCKTELLTRKERCPHGCLYCYWRDR